MSNTFSATPRPRPPAKARRIPSVQFPRFPPPPYAPSLDQVVLDTTASSPGQVSSAALDNLPLPLPSPDAEEWINEKSREELSGLLLKADELIKSRESELSLTSALCKTLYHDNIALKNKHETLLARLPPSAVPTAPTTPVVSSNVLSPPYEEVNLPTSPDFRDTSLPAPRFRHSRRISVTRNELASLADQNAELLDKLEKLEAESEHADQVGKRKLRKLEQEIQVLRDELEQTQTKEAELEEQARVALGSSVMDAQRRREEREERVRAFKEKSSSDSDMASEERRDFAPPSELARPPSLRIPYSPASQSDTASPASVSHLSTKSAVPDTYEEDVSSSSPLRSRLSSTRSQSGAEFAIVSQLLLKIHELEETNAQIKQEQKLTDERRRLAQWDAESIRRVYDCLDGGNGVELEVVTEDELEEDLHKGKRVASGGTIKFSSLRRTIHQNLGQFLDPQEPDMFASGITTDMQSTARNAIGPAKQPTGSHKARKSVVGLFDPDSRSPDIQHSHTPLAWPPPRKSSFETASELGDISTWSTAATDGMALPSPSLSSTLPTPVEGAGQPFGRTLGSELGSEFGDDWGANAPNHHLRSTSLYDIAGLDLSREASMSPSTSERPMFVFPALDDTDSLATESTPRMDVWGADPGPSTPPPLPGLQLMVEPPTPTPDRLQKPKSVRAYRLSQTMRSRTNRWVKGRFSPSESPSPDLPRRHPASTTVRRRSGLDSGIIMGESVEESNDLVPRPGRRGRIPDYLFEDDCSGPAGDSPDELNAEADRSAIQLRADVSGVSQEHSFTGLVVEIWLWLQFAIVILVFLWTMAKRGPKSVLEEAEQRRARDAVGRR